ncbi:MAG TPA: DUF262 domain-containing protein [Phycisphaerales bacterium]|nr:DUF262 domain-containing protein [Phycisphaerales bacterium]
MIAEPLRVSHLLAEVAQGGVLLPEIQRDYVWNGPQVAKLLDSLYHEFPSGQILLWDTQNLPVTKTLVGTTTSALPPASRPKIVLDGQQRLTSLVQALGKPESLANGNGINIFFHLGNETFERYSSKMKRDPLWISVRDVVQASRSDLAILKAISQAGGPSIESDQADVFLQRLQKLKRIADYKFPVEVFRSDDYEEVTELFVRINSGGKRLRTAELALAQLALRLPGQLVESFEDAINDYEDKHYDLDTRFLIRALIAVGTGQSRFRHLTDFWTKRPAEIEQAWKATRKGIDAAVNFARGNARFESSEWLPSLYPLITLTKYFTIYDRLQADVEKQLLQWFYIASVRGRYSSSGETALDEDLKAVLGSDPISALTANATGAVGWIPILPDELDDAGVRNPLYALAFAAARRNGAVDWFTGLSLSASVLGDEHEIEDHHIFPKALLRRAGVRRKDIDEMANLAFLTSRPNKKIGKKPPHEYLLDIPRDRLASQCVPLDPALWRVERYQDFLTERRRLLANAMNALIENPR